MPRMVTVMVLPPDGKAPYTRRIDGDDSGALVALVGGFLGTCSLPSSWRSQDWYAFCDDASMIRPDQPALNTWAPWLGHHVLRGPVVIIKTDAWGEIRSLGRADVADLEMRLVQEPTREADRMAEAEQRFWAEHPSSRTWK